MRLLRSPLRFPRFSRIWLTEPAQGFSSIQYVKSASLPGTLLDPNLESPYSEQFTIGFQRQLPSNMAISADFVLRKRVNEISGADRSRLCD